MGSKTWHEPIERAIERLNAEAGGGDGEPLEGGLYECYLCELLEINPAELATLDYAVVEEQAGWAEGGKIGEWARQHPPNGSE